MPELHALLAYAAVAATIGTLLVAAAGLAVGDRARLFIDRTILVAVIVLVAAALAGLPLIVLVGPPTDVLHLLYGAVAPLLLLGGRYLGRSRSIRRRAAFVAVAAVALLGVIYRLFTTGTPAA